MKRYLHTQILQDLKKKMVFVEGPRQVGKTTLAQQILKTKSGYLNWDIAEHRTRILNNDLPKVLASVIVLLPAGSTLWSGSIIFFEFTPGVAH